MKANQNEQNRHKACCSFYDTYIVPRVERAYEEQEECADILLQFLHEQNMPFDVFYHEIMNHSLGFGLDYIKELDSIMQHIELDNEFIYS